MTVETNGNININIKQAQARVRAEEAVTNDKLDAYETFIRRVQGLETDQTSTSVAGVTAAGGTTHFSADTYSVDGCRTVRTAFTETIYPHIIADSDETESILETISEELTDAIAVALAPTTEVSFTTDIKQIVLAEAQSRRSETAVLQQALAREKTHLTAVTVVVDDIIAWIDDVNETPFHRDCCEDVAHDRQAFLQETTNDCIDAGIRHRSLIPYLYQDFPVDHPVLATITTLNQLCRSCQRTVRDHLVRRV
jgi:hypothetical protein